MNNAYTPRDKMRAKEEAMERVDESKLATLVPVTICWGEAGQIQPSTAGADRRN